MLGFPYNLNQLIWFAFNYSIDLSMPTITHLKQSIVVVAPNMMGERCEATGYPVAKITWLQNGLQMPVCMKVDRKNCAGQNYQAFEITNEDYALSISYLTIASTKYPRDNGSYTCVATNSEGTHQKTMDVSIYSKYKLKHAVTNKLHTCMGI